MDGAHRVTAVFIPIEKWVPYTPEPEQVSLTHEVKGSHSLITVSITFSDAGYRVSDWGEVIRLNNDFWVDAKIERWTGSSAQVITEKSNPYDLGILPKGSYNFTFKAWGEPVKSISFDIDYQPLRYWADIDGDGDVDIRDIQLVAARWRTEPDDKIGGIWDVDEDGDIDIDDYRLVWHRCDVDSIKSHYGDGDGDIDIVDVQLVANQWRWEDSSDTSARIVAKASGSGLMLNIT